MGHRRGYFRLGWTRKISWTNKPEGSLKSLSGATRSDAVSAMLWGRGVSYLPVRKMQGVIEHLWRQKIVFKEGIGDGRVEGAEDTDGTIKVRV